jgi:hypothetical protein
MPTPKPMPMIGPIKGEINIAPIITAVEFIFNPSEATKMAKKLLFQMDSIKKQELRNTQLFAEIKAQYPLVKNAIIQPSVIIGDSTAGKKTIVILLSLSANLPSKEKIKLENWLKVRLNQPNIQLIFQR